MSRETRLTLAGREQLAGGYRVVRDKPVKAKAAFDPRSLQHTFFQLQSYPNLLPDTYKERVADRPLYLTALTMSLELRAPESEVDG